MDDLERFIWQDDDLNTVKKGDTASYAIAPDGKSVMERKGGKWQLLETHKTHAEAVEHMKRLVPNG